MIQRQPHEFTLTRAEVAEATRSQLPAALRPDWELTLNIVDAYRVEGVLPEYPQAVWGVWTRGARRRIRLHSEAVDFSVLARLLQANGRPLYFQVREIIQACIPRYYSITELRAVWNRTRNMPDFLAALRTESGVSIT